MKKSKSAIGAFLAARPYDGVARQFNVATFEKIASQLKDGTIPLPRVAITDGGLQVIIRNTGSISWHALYGSKSKLGPIPPSSLRLGEYPEMSMVEARKLVETVQALDRLGIDVQKGLHERLIRELKAKGAKWRP